jgi:ubiquinone biosynthesis protein COQ9
MDDTEFDRALISAAFSLAAEEGWRRVSVARAARIAELPLDVARRRFGGCGAILRRFGRLADEAALAGSADHGAVRDRLFDMLMRRIDFLQAHRAGALALLRFLPADPPTALMLSAASLRSMMWMLEGAGVSASGPFGMLRAKGLLAVWLWTIRAWQRDESEDMSATMAALDTALARADRAAGWMGMRAAPEGSAEEAASVLADAPEPPAPPEPPAAPEPPPEPPNPTAPPV